MIAPGTISIALLSQVGDEEPTRIATISVPVQVRGDVFGAGVYLDLDEKAFQGALADSLRQAADKLERRITDKTSAT